MAETVSTAWAKRGAALVFAATLGLHKSICLLAAVLSMIKMNLRMDVLAYLAVIVGWSLRKALTVGGYNLDVLLYSGQVSTKAVMIWSMVAAAVAMEAIAGKGNVRLSSDRPRSKHCYCCWLLLRLF